MLIIILFTYMKIEGWTIINRVLYEYCGIVTCVKFGRAKRGRWDEQGGSFEILSVELAGIYMFYHNLKLEIWYQKHFFYVCVTSVL